VSDGHVIPSNEVAPQCKALVAGIIEDAVVAIANRQAIRRRIGQAVRTRRRLARAIGTDDGSLGGPLGSN